MFGGTYFGAHYFGPHYFGKAGAVIVFQISWADDVNGFIGMAVEGDD